MRRTTDGWKSITWKEALDEVAVQVRRIQSRWGANAVGLYTGNPVAHSHGALLMNDAFIKALGSKARFSALSCDGLPHMLAAYKMFGHFLSNPVPDIDRTDFFLCLGGNPIVSNGSFFSAPNVRGRLKALRERGGRFILFDPRRTETALMADEHHFIRPGRDWLLLLSLLHVVFDEKAVRWRAAQGLVKGWDELAALVLPFSPEATAPETGIPVQVVRGIAQSLCAASSAAVYGRMGVATSAHGALSAWLIYVLNTVTGNLDRPGGVMFSQPAIDVVGLTGALGLRGSFDSWRSRVRGLPEFNNEMPAQTMAEEILTPGPGQVRGMIIHAGNPVLSVPNGGQLDTALSSLEFMVSIDFYLNETSRHAHIILPPTGPLERGYFPLGMSALSVRNTARYSAALIPREQDALHDWEILAELIARFKGRSSWSRWWADSQLWRLRRAGDEGLLDALIRWGPYGSGSGWFRSIVRHLEAPGLAGIAARGGRGLASRVLRATRRGRQLADATTLGGLGRRWKPNQSVQLDFQTLARHRHGLDLGPLQPMLSQRIFHRDGRMDLAPECFVEEVRRLQGLVRQDDQSAFLLIGRRHSTSNNSWMHNFPRLTKGGDRCDLWMSPADALKTGIVDGQTVRVVRGIRQIELAVRLTSNMMPGVVSMPHGWGHHRPGCQQRVAERHPGVSMNDLLDADSVDEFSGTAQLNGVEVHIFPSM